MTTETIQTETFTHRKIYPNGDIFYTKFDVPLNNGKKPNEKLENERFLIRIKEYKNDVDSGESKYTFQELIEQDYYYEKMLRKETESRNKNVKRSQRRIRTTLKDYVLCNNFTWFVTLTDKDQLTDRKEFSKRIRTWVDNLRKRHYKDLQYILIMEQHKSGAWHAHALFNDSVASDMVYAQKHKGKDSFNFKKWRYGFTTASKIEDKTKVAHYVLKYITKDLFYIKNQQAYYVSQGLELPIKESGSYLVRIEKSERYYTERDFATYYQSNQFNCSLDSKRL